MVAVKAGALTVRDILSDHLWEDWQCLAYRRAREVERMASGQTMADAIMGAAEDLRVKLSDAPSFRERQRIAAMLRPDVTTGGFTADEVRYLIERLDGVNDAVGASALRKLLSMVEKD